MVAGRRRDGPQVVRPGVALRPCGASPASEAMWISPRRSVTAAAPPPVREQRDRFRSGGRACDAGACATSGWSWATGRGGTSGPRSTWPASSTTSRGSWPTPRPHAAALRDRRGRRRGRARRWSTPSATSAWTRCRGPGGAPGHRPRLLGRRRWPRPRTPPRAAGLAAEFVAGNVLRRRRARRRSHVRRRLHRARRHRLAARHRPVGAVMAAPHRPGRAAVPGRVPPDALDPRRRGPDRHVPVVPRPDDRCAGTSPGPTPTSTRPDRPTAPTSGTTASARS